MKQTKWNHVLAVLGVIGFGLMLAVLFVRTCSGEKATYSYYENRNLAEKPAFTLEGAMDGSYYSRMESYVQDHAAARNVLIKAKTFVEMNVLKRPVVNDVVITGEALLPWRDYESIYTPYWDNCAQAVSENLAAHAADVEAYGGTFLYVAVPCQYVCYEQLTPWYINSRKQFTDFSTQALFSRLEEKGVRYLDMGAVFDRLGGRENFSSTVDNHFGIDGSYATYRAIMEALAEAGYDLDVLDESNSVVKELPNPYLGSRNRKLYGLWKSVEKLAVLEPVDAPAFRRWENGMELEPFINKMPENDSDEVLYGLFMGGDMMHTRIATDRPELPRVVVYGDSFTNAVESMLWYSFDEMVSFDFRYNKNITLEEYIAQAQPDIVICIRDYEALLSPEFNGQ